MRTSAIIFFLGVIVVDILLYYYGKKKYNLPTNQAVARIFLCDIATWILWYLLEELGKTLGIFPKNFTYASETEFLSTGLMWVSLAVCAGISWWLIGKWADKNTENISNNNSSNLTSADKIRILKKKMDEGKITNEEFEKKKKDLL